MSRYTMVIDGRPVDVELTELGSGRYRAIVNGRAHEVVLSGATASPQAYAPMVVGAPPSAAIAPAPAPRVPVAAPAPMVAQAPTQVVAAPRVAAAPAAATTAGARAVVSPMPGKVTAVNAKEGETVKRGAPIATIEAMKMNVPIAAPIDGKVGKIHVKVGDSLQSGQLVAEIVG